MRRLLSFILLLTVLVQTPAAASSLRAVDASATAVQKGKLHSELDLHSATAIAQAPALLRTSSPQPLLLSFESFISEHRVCSPVSKNAHHSIWTKRYLLFNFPSHHFW